MRTVANRSHWVNGNKDSLLSTHLGLACCLPGFGVRAPVFFPGQPGPRPQRGRMSSAGVTQLVTQGPGLSFSWVPSTATGVVRYQALGPQVKRVGFACSLTLALPTSNI